MGRKVLNLSEVIASPVISGENEEYIWTGVVKSENITPLLIKDDEVRKEFTKLVKDLERSTKRFRRDYDIESNVQTFMIEDNFLEEAEKLEDHIIEVGGKIKEYLAGAEEYGIDMDLFWVLLCRDYEEIFEKNPNEFKAMSENARKTLKIFRKDFNENDPCVTEFYISEENKFVCFQFLTRGQEKKYMVPNGQNEENLLKVIRSIAGKEDLSKDEENEILKELVTGVTVLDLASIFKNPRHAEMQYLTLFKNYLLKKGYKPDELEKMEPYEVADTALTTYNSDKIEFHAELVSQTIKENLPYIDLERLLLVSTIRPLEAFEFMMPKVDEEELTSETIVKLSEKAKEVEETADAYIQQECNLDTVIQKNKRTEYLIKKVLETGIIGNKTRFNLMYDEQKREVSLKRLQEMMKKFCDGIYLTDVVELNLKYNALFSEDEMSKWSDELVGRMNFSEDEIYFLSTINFENLKRLYVAGKMDKDHIKTLIRESRYEIEKQSEEEVSQTLDMEDIDIDTIRRINLRNMFKDLYDSKIIAEEDIVEYFKEGIVTPEMIMTLEESKTQEQKELLYENLRSIFNEEMILYGYKQYEEEYVKFMKMQLTADGEKTEELKEQREIVNCLREHKDDRIKLFNRYRNMTKEEKHLLGDELLEYYYIVMDVSDEDVVRESVITLYEDGMIDLENIIGLDKKYIIPMLDTLSLEDASKVRASMSFDELRKLLDDIFEDKSVTDERKHVILMNLLIEGTKEDREAREFYKNKLGFKDGLERKADPTGNKRQKTGNGTILSNKYVYPDFVKWAFYKSLDKNVMIKPYANGFVEFASSKLGVRILEKYHDKKFRPAYGTATYILPEDEYKKHQSDLVTITPKGNILESATLREITPRKDRVIHRTKSTDRTWLDEMVRYFGIEFDKKDSRYTEEELETLKNVVNTYRACKDDYEL